MKREFRLDRRLKNEPRMCSNRKGIKERMTDERNKKGDKLSEGRSN